MGNREKFTTPLEIDIDLMADNIKCLVFRIDEEMKQNQQRQRQLIATKLNLQTICQHEFEQSGQTHGGQWEKCKICGYEQR